MKTAKEIEKDILEDVVKLQKHIGTKCDGDIVEFDQWIVELNGCRVGYLPKAVDSRLMPTVNLPELVWNNVVKRCEELRSPPGKVLPPFAIHFPETKEQE